MTATPPARLTPRPLDAPPRGFRAIQETGKAGLALLMWILGVPGTLVLLYLIFG